MKIKLLFVLSAIFAGFLIQAESGNEVEKVVVVNVPNTEIQAQELFLKAWKLEQEKQLPAAIEHYQKVLEFYRKKKLFDHAIATLNNMGGIFAQIGEHNKAKNQLQQALQLAVHNNKYHEGAQLYHKLGIIYDHMAKVKDNAKNNPHDIFKNKQNKKSVLNFQDRTYAHLFRENNRFKANYIQFEGRVNPYLDKEKICSKAMKLTVRSDFAPNILMVPDMVEIKIVAHSKGHFPLEKKQTLLSGLEYLELDEMMEAIPRQVKPKISEDFYKNNEITADEISLSRIEGKKTTTPVAINDKENFKPGNYILTVKKVGYNTVHRNISIHPGEGAFHLPVFMESKMRELQYRVQGNFLGEPNLEPDEISLDGEKIHKDSKVKPGEYKLTIKKEGYEPIIKEVIIPPDDRHFVINEFMQVLPREVVCRVTGDYTGKDQFIMPDEIAFNGHPFKSGDKVIPDYYRVSIRKKGYDLINEQILIEPNAHSYVLKRLMVSTPRRIDFNVFSDFPKGKRLLPEISTLNDRTVSKEEVFKPGKYTLFVSNGGFHTLTKTIQIAPDEEPFNIHEIMRSKARALEIELTRDVAPEDSELDARIYLVNERTNEIIQVKNGDKVVPENYLLKIEQPGYEPDFSKHMVFANEEPYKINRRLTASMRAVESRITAEFPNKTIVPDEIALDNAPLAKDFKIKPGNHDLVILSEGYLPVREPAKILASPKEYRINKLLKTRPRLVDLVFLDSLTGILLTPEQVIMNDYKISAGETQNLKPGNYNLQVKLSGYKNLGELVEIPVGVGSYKLERKLVAIRRPLLLKITEDYDDRKLKLDEIDLVTLNDIPISNWKDPQSSHKMIRPGKYRLLIQKRGYGSILKEIIITPASIPYEIQERLISKSRKLETIIHSSFSHLAGKTIEADSLTIAGEEIKENDQIKPGRYTLTIEKKGYQAIEEKIAIEPAEVPYEIERTLETLARKVRYKIISDFDNKPVELDTISIDDKNIDEEMEVIPGKYVVKIEKMGYYPQKQELLIAPSDQPFLIHSIMVSMEREVELNITSDYPELEPIDPDIAVLNGKNVGDFTFKPGHYVMEIQQPGFAPIKEEIVLSPGEEPHVVERVLTSLPRLLQEDISFDVPAPEELKKRKITLAPAETPDKEIIVKHGDKVKPGEYVLRIEKEAYESVERRQYIWPAAEPLKIKEELKARAVMLLINVSYDVRPKKQSKCTVSLIDESNIPRLVEHGNRIRPGKYQLNVVRPGYRFGPAKEIYILPSESPYHINEHLIAKERRISFNMVDTSIPDRRKMVEAYKIINKRTGEEVNFENKFLPGREVELIIKFKKYKTVTKIFMIEPGEGPYEAAVPLENLKPAEFSVRYRGKDKPSLEMDGIKYDYLYYVDLKPIEQHLLHPEPGPNKWYYTVWLEKNASMLRMVGGYMFIQKNIGQRIAFSKFNAIDIARLIDHMEKIKNMPNRGRRGAVEVMEKGLRRPRWKRMLKQCNRDQIENLMHYIESLGEDQALLLRVRVVLDILEKL